MTLWSRGLRLERRFRAWQYHRLIEKLRRHPPYNKFVSLRIHATSLQMEIEELDWFIAQAEKTDARRG